MPEINDHPDITAAIRTGYPRGKQPKTHRCPVCGEEIDAGTTLYINWANEIVGCSDCLLSVDAEEHFNDN